ncbi:MAG: signal peptidase I [Dehalococcoidia bacterium]
MALAAVLAYTLTAFLLVNYVLADALSAEMNLYVAQPAMWGGLCAMSLVLSRRTGAVYTLGVRILLLAVWAAGFQVACQISVGVLYGFGYSPYAREPLHMLQNAFYLVTLVAGVEASRAYVLHSLRRRSEYLSLAVVSVLWAALLIPVINYESLSSTEGAFTLAGGTLLPALSLSVLASYLAVHGGALPAFLYHAGIRAFEWFSPILPNAEWTIVAFMGTIVPLTSAICIRGAIVAPQAEESRESKPFDVSAPWIVATMLIVALLWFNTGLLGVTPSVVSGVSMEPSMSLGDVVLMRETDPENIKVGDVIQYRVPSGSIFHRVIEIEETTTGLVFITQGDNNNTPDDPVLQSQVEGRIVYTIPKVGWVPIKIGDVLNMAH